MLSISFINVNGWTNSNNILRQNIIKVLDRDIVCIAETHLAKDKTVSFENYTWFGYNRESKHVKSPITHGGVGILVKNNIFTTFNVCVVDKEVDGILVVQFKSKINDTKFVLFCCYLPPANSPWAEPTTFFNHLLTQLYVHKTADLILLCGDFNARIGRENDSTNFDKIPNRIALDTYKNSYSEIFLDFLKDSKCCVLNGRFPDDNFTSTHRCNAVVDYVITPHDCFEMCLNFKVLLINDFITEYNLFPHINAQCKPPDHSVLCEDVVVNNEIINENQGKGANCPVTNCKTKKYDFENIPGTFMQNDNWISQINDLLEKLQKTENKQHELDSVYSEFCKCTIAEMDKHLNYKVQSKSLRKRFKSYKPFWNNELTKMWKAMCLKEKSYISAKKNQQHKRTLRLEFINARKIFDKRLRYFERQYNNKIITTIEDVSSTNPREFWKKIKNLGPRKTKIPFSVYDDENALCSDPSTVLGKWQSEFEKLYSIKNVEHDENYQNILSHKHLLENLSDTENLNQILNGSISFDEIEKVINGVNLGKACGHDGIYNEVLKNNKCKHVLYRLFNLCFEYGKVPAIWQKAIISPVPKSAMKDPHVPAEYRAVSLLSHVGKLYSQVLNNRIMSYCECTDLLCDEQNGFRKLRSCEDHIFTLTTIIRNRIKAKKETYVAFIDMQKAFDWVNRNLLWYKLLVNNITGKIYWAVQSI